MGIRLEDLTPKVLRCMEPGDLELYQPGIHPPYQEDHHPPPKTDTPEKVDQKQFAAWCAQMKFRPVWHATHKPSTANRGCPDFVVAAYGTTFWIEFKRVGEDLRPDQIVFKKQLEANGVPMYVCYSAFEAMQVISQYGAALGLLNGTAL
jgi:hypothetical protein